MTQWVKNLPAMQEMQEDASLIPGSGRSPGGEKCNPLQYSCLENPMDRQAWWAIAHRLSKARTQLKQLSMQAHKHISLNKYWAKKIRALI